MAEIPYSDPDYPEKRIFCGQSVWIGTFRCPLESAVFHAPAYFTGPNLITFPRTAVELRMLGHPPIIGSPNIAVFYNPNQAYSRHQLAPEGDFCDWFAYDPRLLREVIGLYEPAAAEREKRPFCHTHTPLTTRWLLLQRTIVEQLLHHQPDPFWVDEMALLLLAGIIHDSFSVRGHRPAPPKTATQRSHQQLIGETQRLLQTEFQQPLTLTELAHAVSSSPFHLARIFRQQTGFTIHQYREQLRLRTALEWLPAYQNDLSTLALELGYKNHSQFTHAFHRSFGLPPSQMSYKIAYQQLQN